MIHTFAVLLFFQFVGEFAARALGLPIPGPVIGMALLLLVLLARGQIGQELRDGAGGLLSHLSLFFVPAGVGIVVLLRRVGEEWLAISLALFISTLAGLAVTAWVMRAMMRLRRFSGERS